MSNYSFSLNLGFIGTGISSLISSICFAAIPIIYLLIMKTFSFNFFHRYIDRKNILIYFKNMLIAVLKQLLEILFFSYMIIGMMNKIGNQVIY